METLYLSRRNLLTLLSKLDRKAAGEDSKCTLIKRDHTHPYYPATMREVEVIAVEDDDYYIDRLAGEIHPADEQKINTKGENNE